MGVLILNYLVSPYQNVEAAWNILVEREKKNPWVLSNSNIKRPDILVIHIDFNGIGFWQLKTLEKNVESVKLGF